MDPSFVVRAAAQVGCALVYVPPGPFLLGSAADPRDSAARFEVPQHTVTLPGYAIGRTAVTNAEYARFIADGGYSTATWWSEEGWRIKEAGDESWDRPARGRSAWTAPAMWGQDGWSEPEQPVTGVHWYEAEAYCQWLSSKAGLPVVLPDEAEWEKAARGTDGRRYPWGDAPPTAALCTFALPWQTGRPSPVGRCSPQGDSPYGCADMAGNVMEWTRSPFLAYPFQPEPRASFGTVVARGGCWSSSADGVRCAQRAGHNSRVMRERDGSVVRAANMGFRIVVLSTLVSAQRHARAFLREFIAAVEPADLVNQIELYVMINGARVLPGLQGLETLLQEPGQEDLLLSLVAQDAAWRLDPPTAASARRWLEWLVQQLRREIAENWLGE